MSNPVAFICSIALSNTLCSVDVRWKNKGDSWICGASSRSSFRLAMLLRSLMAPCSACVPVPYTQGPKEHPPSFSLEALKTCTLPCSGPSSRISRNVLNVTNGDDVASGTGVERTGSNTVFNVGCEAPAWMCSSNAHIWIQRWQS